jgi:Chaperone of endosialidase
MTNLRRFLLCCGIALLGGNVWADEIQNWSAPPYWGGPVRARVPEESRGGLGTEAAEVLPTAPVPFVAIVPCRIVDTRGNGFTGAYGPPALSGGATARAFNVPAGPCPGIPADAAAFSINIGAILPAADGFLTAYPTGGALPTVSNVNFLANEVIANAAVIGAGTSGSISIFVNVTTHVIVDINGYYRGGLVTALNGLSGNVTLTSASPDLIQVTPQGQNIEFDVSPNGFLPDGTQNQTLRHNGSTWEASSVLLNDGSSVIIPTSLVPNSINFPGSVSIGSVGFTFLNNPGTGNTLLGLNTGTGGSDNTTVGAGAGGFTSGSGNIAIGRGALSFLSTGSGNIGIGVNVAPSLSSGSNNLYIGNPGSGNESGQIRIGRNDLHTQGTVIASIYGFGSSGGIPVIVNSGGRLGTTTSSARFKEDVRSIGAESDDLMKLRPVAFRYRESHEPGGLKQYGLIAEEVAEIYPELVVNDDQGRPFAIRSQLLEPLFLNELQKQRQTIDAQRAEIDELKAKLTRLESLVREGD